MRERERVKGRVVGSGRRESGATGFSLEPRGGGNLVPRRGRDALPSLSSVSFAADSDGRASCELRVYRKTLDTRSSAAQRRIDSLCRFRRQLRGILVFHAVVRVVFKFEKVFQKPCGSFGVAW